MLRPVEHAKAINRDRTSYSFKAVSCAYIASAFNFEIEIKNIILAALRIFGFSHGPGPEADLALQAVFSTAMACSGHQPIADDRFDRCLVGRMSSRR
jgi:hypothetical protein